MKTATTNFTGKESKLPLHALTAPGDCLVLASGQPPRLRSGGTWTSEEGALEAELFQRIRAQILDACVPSDEAVGAATPRLLPLEDHRALSIDWIDGPQGDALWLRPALVVPPDPSCLSGDPDRLTEIMRLSRGFVVTGGPDLDSARAMLYALTAAFVARRPGSLAIVSRDVTYRTPAMTGPCARVTPSAWPDVARAVRPDLVVIDPAIASGELQIEDFECVPRVLACAVGMSLPVLATRLIARLTGGDFGRAQAALGAVPFGVVIATPTGDDGGRIPYTAKLLSDGQRVAVLRNDPAGLTANFAT